MVYLYIIAINIILLISLYIAYKRKLYQYKSTAAKQAADAYVQSRQKELDELAQRESKKLYDERDQLRRDVNEKLSQLSSLNGELVCISKTITEQRERARVNEEKMRESAEQMAKAYEADLLKVAEQKVALQREGMYKAAQQIYAEEMAQLSARTEAARASLATLEQAVLEYSIKQTAINEAILRQRAIEEQQDFYRICLTPEAKSDINYLISIIPNLKNPTTLYKLIWSEYIQKQFNQMLKNVLGATDPKNVIYSITNLKTNEIYIGKTKAEVSKRWSEHIKSSLNIGTIKSTKIHEALYNHWDEFVFAIVEKVPIEENLSMREKFYIDFYQSNIYGYNLKSGG